MKPASTRSARRRLGPEARIRRATEGWFITEPLLFAAWMTHRLVERSGVESLRIGDGRVEYHPAFIDALPDKVLSEMLRLEAVRILLKHPYSRRPASGEIAYLASNITLKEHLPTTLPLPSAQDVFGDPSFSRQYFEFYCDRLVDHRRGARADGRRIDAASSEDAPGDEPGGAASSPEQAPEGASHFDAERGPERTQLWQEETLAREQIDSVIREAEASRMWGSLPGALVAQILATLRPQLDYRKVLRSFRTSILASRRELTRMKPSRRYGFTYMGSRHALRTRLLVAVDVSGSIDDLELGKAFSVINRLFQYGIESIDVVQFDTEIKGPAETLRARRPRVTVLGRGGTSFDPVLHYIDEHGDYDGLIIVTDGMAPRPAAPRNRRTRVLWLFQDQRTYRAMRENVAHIGRAVYIKPEAAHETRGHRRPPP